MRNWVITSPRPPTKQIPVQKWQWHTIPSSHQIKEVRDCFSHKNPSTLNLLPHVLPSWQMRRKSTEKQTRHIYFLLLHPVWIMATKTCIIGQNPWTKNNVNVVDSHSFFKRFINTHTHTHTHFSKPHNSPNYRGKERISTHSDLPHREQETRRVLDKWGLESWRNIDALLTAPKNFIWRWKQIEKNQKMTITTHKRI